MLLSVDTTVAHDPTSQFGVFGQLSEYGALGLIVLALGYVCWMFIQKKLKEVEELKTKLEEARMELIKTKMSK